MPSLGLVGCQTRSASDTSAMAETQHQHPAPLAPSGLSLTSRARLPQPVHPYASQVQ